MFGRQLIIDLLGDLAVPFCFLIIGVILDFIEKRYNNYIEEKKSNSPEFGEKYEKTKDRIKKAEKTTFEIIYRLLSYIVMAFVVILSIGAIAFGVIGIIQHEEIDVCIAGIIIGLIIGLCGYLFIKGDKHEYEYESSEDRKEKIKKMIDNAFEEENTEENTEEIEKPKNKKKSSKK